MANRDRLTPALFAWNDLLLSLLACLLVAAFLIAAKKQQETKTETDRSAGNVSVYTFWREGDIDIDTHMRDPDGEHVYFSHRAGKVWNLLRDDLGKTNDVTPRNFENAYARGLPPGEYAVNVHAYRNNSSYPIEVDAELRIQSELKAGSAITFTARVTLDHLGDEATLWRFSIDDRGHLIPGSVHSQFIQLARPDK
jgi:uncharacterized protein YfaP (DUF2135 family)